MLLRGWSMGRFKKCKLLKGVYENKSFDIEAFYEKVEVIRVLKDVKSINYTIL